MKRESEHDMRRGRTVFLGLCVAGLPWGLAWLVLTAGVAFANSAGSAGQNAGPAEPAVREPAEPSGAGPVKTAVRVRQGTLTLPTYEEGLPDVNPRFDLFARRPFLIYPYTARTNLTDRRADRTWRTLELENEYIKLVVLPDLGGRIYSCVDKATGAEMFYANPAIKFADVAYRGAWVALGV